MSLPAPSWAIQPSARLKSPPFGPTVFDENIGIWQKSPPFKPEPEEEYWLQELQRQIREKQIAEDKERSKSIERAQQVIRFKYDPEMVSAKRVIALFDELPPIY